MNKLYFGDNLTIMREMEDGFVDLIATDPPFNSGRNYNAFFSQAQAQKKAFTDTWNWDTVAEQSRADITERANANDTYKALDMCLKGYDLVLQNAVSGNKGAMRAYLAFMGPRLAEMHRLLKDTGSIYLHCDPTASHYLKGVMDAIFDVENFRNEIIWKRTHAHNDGKQYGRIHDTILFYSKVNNQWIWNPIYTEHDPEYIEKSYRYEDERGRYRLVTLNAPGVSQGESGKSWRGIDPTTVGRHWAAPMSKAWPKDIQPSDNYETLSVHEKLDMLDAHGMIYWPPKGKIPQFKRYLSTSEGKRVQDIITDINKLETNSKERLDYPTQKPLALYERIIKASSNAGDLVMDPFAGCGTTIDAAHSLNRFWIGIDLTIIALDPIKQRMADRHTGQDGEPLQPHKHYEVDGYPTNMQEVYKLVKDEKKYHDFSNWAVTRLGLIPTQDVGDGGKDAVGHVMLWEPDTDSEKERRIIAEVKTGKPTLSQVRAFRDTMNEQNAVAGVFITLEPVTRGMRQLAADMGDFEIKVFAGVENKRYPRLQFWQIDDTYFENSERITEIIRLPQQWIKPRKKSERHTTTQQMSLLTEN